MRFPALAVLAFAAAAALSSCGGAGDGVASAPDFTLASPDGRPFALSGQKGRVVLLNFWATWCDSCNEELPDLQKIHADLAKDAGFELVAVSVDDDPAKVVPGFAAAHAIRYPIVYADPKVMQAYAVRMLPTTFLIAPDGTISRRYVGPLNAEAVENDILGLLKRRPS
jgi:peroxiredoxin